MRRLLVAPLLLCLLWTAVGQAAGSSGARIAWEPWSDAVFERAAREESYVLLDLEAVWCHWCHVMEEVTYRDPKVVELIKAKYIPVRVDQDSRPGYRASLRGLRLACDGGVQRGGWRDRQTSRLPRTEIMISMLEEIIVDPSPVKYRRHGAVREISRTTRC